MSVQHFLRKDKSKAEEFDDDDDDDDDDAAKWQNSIFFSTVFEKTTTSFSLSLSLSHALTHFPVTSSETCQLVLFCVFQENSKKEILSALLKP